MSGEGSALMQSLEAAMTAGHIQRRYGDFRNSAALHDADPAGAGKIVLVYNEGSVSSGWDQGSTWNREHVWPQSRQPGSASNSTRGNLGDPHALRPCNPGVNSSRSNRPFGFASTNGSFGPVGSYWYPGTVDKGDIARSLFYSATRWESLGIALVDGFPSGNQMGGLDSLVAWHYADPPDEFERRRNHVIYSQAENPSYYTNNRNAFVDLPGVVWSVFEGNQNNSTLWLGDAFAVTGASLVEACDRALVGQAPLVYTVQLQRSGSDGVYYLVEASGDAVTDQPSAGGFSGAFAIGDVDPRSIAFGIRPSAITGPGLFEGSVTVDNLDVTTGLGSGFGGLDGDDTATVTMEVLAPSQASFDPGAFEDTLEIDVGTVPVGDAFVVSDSIHALDGVPGFTAGAVVSLFIESTGGADVETTLPMSVIEAGASALFSVEVTPVSEGAISVGVLLSTADDPSIRGADQRESIFVVITGTAVGSFDFDLDGSGGIDFFDVLTGLSLFAASDPAIDVDGSGSLTTADLEALVAGVGAAGL